jgi:endogenous inhibitor of DNA gyrase (YacG/DUF329 family)
MTNTNKKNDCPKCRRRTRRWVVFGSFRFCTKECAITYAADLQKWLDIEQARLNELKRALL